MFGHSGQVNLSRQDELHVAGETFHAVMSGSGSVEFMRIPIPFMTQRTG